MHMIFSLGNGMQRLVPPNFEKYAAAAQVGRGL
jgi:hypothetical protein